MDDVKATATAHMWRDVEAGKAWTCSCDACVSFRSLVGMEKMLEVRPLVRAIEHMSSQIERVSPGPERQRLFDEYLALHDKLAKVVAE